MIYNSTPKNTQNPQFAGARIWGRVVRWSNSPSAATLSCAPTWVRRTTRSHQRRKLRKLSRVPQVGRSGRLAPRRGRAPSGSTTCSHSAASRHCFLSGLSTAAFNQLHAHRVHTVCTAAAARRRARELVEGIADGKPARSSLPPCVCAGLSTAATSMSRGSNPTKTTHGCACLCTRSTLIHARAHRTGRRVPCADSCD